MTVRLRRHLGFRRFWGASTISDFGTQVGAIAVGVLVVADLGGSAADVGLVQGAGVAPYLVLGLFAGVLAGRVRRRPVLAGTDLARAAVLGCVPLLAVAGALTVPLLAAIMLVFGTLSVVNAAAHQSFLPRLLPRVLLHRANTRLEQSAALAQTTGRLLGGGLVAAVGAPLAVLVDAVSYAVSGLLVAVTPVHDPRPRPGTRSVPAELAEGARWVFTHPTLRPLALGTHAWFLFNAVISATYVPYALVELGIGPIGLGVTFALSGLGALLGSSASERLGHRVGIAATIAGSRVLEAAGILVVTAAAAAAGPAAVAIAAAGQFLYGLGLGAEGPVELAYRQASPPTGCRAG